MDPTRHARARRDRKTDGPFGREEGDGNNVSDNIAERSGSIDDN